MSVNSVHHAGSLHLPHFLRHLLEMLAAMLAGMIPAAAVFSVVAGMSTDQALRRHAVLFVAVMAVAMTVPMVAWMRFRGHGRRACLEMAAVALLPAVPLICLRVAGVIGGPICGAYCALSIIAMVGLVLYRRDDYRHVSSAASAAAG